MLELALVFQPVDEEMEQFDREQTFPYENQPGRLLIQAFSLSSAGLTRFIDESISAIFESCSSDDLRMSRARAEVLLHKYNWDANKLQIEYLTDREKVLAVANLSAEVGVATTEATFAQSSSMKVAGGEDAYFQKPATTTTTTTTTNTTTIIITTSITAITTTTTTITTTTTTTFNYQIIV